MSKEDLKEVLEDEEKAAEEKTGEETVNETGADSGMTGESGAEEKEEKKEESKEESKEDTSEPKKSAEEEALELKYMRLMADFQNFRRRTEKEKSDIYQFANEGIVKELLDVVDNFERAFEADTADESFKEGMKMIFKQLQGVLERAGVVEIDCLGQEFDPNFENAVMTEDSTEYDSGKVTKVLQKGYKLHDRVVRPAMVVTAN